MSRGQRATSLASSPFGPRNVRLVMARGQLHDAAELLASAKGKMGPATTADDDWWKGRLRFK